MQITININNADTEPSVHVTQHFDAPAAEAIPRIPVVFGDKMTNGDRGMLWAAYTDAFGTTSDQARAKFTRTVLGLSNEDDASWSAHGTITSDQAYYMTRVLNAIAEIL